MLVTLYSVEFEPGQWAAGKIEDGWEGTQSITDLELEKKKRTRTLRNDIIQVSRI